jgi:predicted small integral membrane protein
MAPALLWFSHSVGLARLWHEVVVHPLAMLQPLAVPDLFVPQGFSRGQITKFFVVFQLRLYVGLYAAYLGVLGWRGLRAYRSGERFHYAFLLSIVVFGAVFFIRSLGRADEPHLDSAIPPVLLLIAHGTSVVFDRLWKRKYGGKRKSEGRVRRRHAELLTAAALFVCWVLVTGSDLQVRRQDRMIYAIPNIAEEIRVNREIQARTIGTTVEAIQTYSEPNDTLLDLSPSPFFYVLAERLGPGYFDTVMPGTFTDPTHELAFLDRLMRSPPKLVIWPREIFDDMQERKVQRSAPALTRWVKANYAPVWHSKYVVLRHRDHAILGAPSTK